MIRTCSRIVKPLQELCRCCPRLELPSNHAPSCDPSFCLLDSAEFNFIDNLQNFFGLFICKVPRVFDYEPG